MSSFIQIPDDAPFSSEQRVWLGQFLTQLLAGATTGSAPSGPAVPVTILWGSQTGNAEGLAKKLVKLFKKGNFEPESFDMAAYDRGRLPQEKNLLVITSTYGDGEPPDNAGDLHGWLMSDTAPRLEGVNFSVLALGDTSYPDFCKCGIEFDTRLEELGATRIFRRVDSDVDYDTPFKEWSDGLFALLAPAGAASYGAAAAVEQIETGYSKKNPFPSPILRNFDLNRGGDKQTHHIELSLAGSELDYEVGDALGLCPLNPAEVVDEILANLPFKTTVEVPSPDGGEISLRDALISVYDIGTLNKSIIQKWQARSGSPFLRSLVQADDKKAWDDFCWGRDLIDLVIDHPADFTDAEEFVGVLKKLQPRLYSIASSPKAHPGEVHLCVGIVRYNSFGRKRGGICSTFLADRAKDVNPGVYVHANKAFRLPDSGETPLIMVGPGTGIAPFRAFLEERKFSGAKGPNWLFFGNPHRATDFLYEEELLGFQQDGTLSKLDLAWSRDQKEKIYVQDLMLQQAAELWKWFQNGAAFYVCGDASRMAKDVDAALHRIAEEQGGLSTDDAVAWVGQLKKDKRYLRDVY
ncbi:MAG: sulfite reductase subunit alpha [Verrucomicrobia bacterium]|nr:MAG: sulfite reductase subunit alpha [Verrucomicrobiota bacterium]TAE89254.1 MAG: sulfite reductase subunit alpha [Verrucomicrobiota bacterium]TAF27872.1 MAG: sulfite reductase subunit alpha [Verrucomicrobiota bacterium]TAF42721.1 MAG: sulfite reductase subunit alpha [Verrucomicrobiota bacterium]